MPQAGFELPAQSHASYEGSTLPPSHHGWFSTVLLNKKKKVCCSSKKNSLGWLGGVKAI